MPEVGKKLIVDVNFYKLVRLRLYACILNCNRLQ